MFNLMNEEKDKNIEKLDVILIKDKEIIIKKKKKKKKKKKIKKKKKKKKIRSKIFIQW